MSKELFAIAEKVTDDYGITGLRSVAVGGGSDGNHTAAVGVRTLDGIGAVLTPAQLRLSVVDIGSVNPKAGMPSFHKSEAAASSGRLTPQEIEDVVAYLATLKD